MCKKCFDKSIINCLIEFASTGNICIDAENFLALLHAHKSCAQFLKSCIDDSSCLMILQTSGYLRSETAERSRKMTYHKTPQNGNKGNGFLTLPCLFLKELLGNNYEEICVLAKGLIPFLVLQAVLM